jgi:hypothetical protein
MMLNEALREFVAALDDLEANLGFIQASKKLRPRLGDMLKWTEMGGEAKALAQGFIKQAGVEETSLYRGMVVTLCGALEEFARRVLRDSVLAINKATTSYDELEDHLKLQNLLRTGQALQTIFEPLDHLAFDYERLCTRLGTCVKGSLAFQLNDDAFTMYVSSVAPPHLEELLRRLGLNLNWDHIGQDNKLQAFFDARGAHATAKATQDFLQDVIRKRNKIAHSGSGGVVITDLDFAQMLQFFRLFSVALAKVICDNLLKSIPKKKLVAARASNQ